MLKTRFLSTLGLGLILGAVAFQSCTKGKNKLKYDLPLQTGSVEVTVPPTSDTTNAKELGTGVNTFNIDSFIRANTNNLLGISNIQSVKLTSVTLKLSPATPTNNFANLQSYYASFYTSGNTTPYTIPVTLNNDEFSDTKTLPVDPNVELKGYLNGNNFTYNVGGKLRRPITDSLKCKIEFKFMVSVQG
jgi:hypothetical protein